MLTWLFANKCIDCTGKDHCFWYCRVFACMYLLTQLCFVNTVNSYNFRPPDIFITVCVCVCLVILYNKITCFAVFRRLSLSFAVFWVFAHGPGLRYRPTVNYRFDWSHHRPQPTTTDHNLRERVRDMVRDGFRVRVLGIGLWLGLWLGLALGPVSTAVIFTPILLICKRWCKRKLSTSE